MSTVAKPIPATIIDNPALADATTRKSKSPERIGWVGHAAAQWANMASRAALSLQDVARDLTHSPRHSRGSWNRTPLGPLIQRTLAEQDKPGAVSAQDPR